MMPSLRSLLPWTMHPLVSLTARRNATVIR
jgi:hypothetical protein